MLALAAVAGCGTTADESHPVVATAQVKHVRPLAFPEDVVPTTVKPAAPSAATALASLAVGSAGEAPTVSMPATPAAAYPQTDRDDRSVRAELQTIYAAPRVAVRMAPAEVQALLRKAAAHYEQGVTLASRGALFSARSEFFEALRSCVQARNGELGSMAASESLAAALRALDEAKDLVPRAGQLDESIDLAYLARQHETPVLRTPGYPTAPLAAVRQAYAAFAEQQLHAAVGPLPIGSSVLHALGKVHGLIAEQSSPPIQDGRFKALVLQRAAVRVNPGNYVALNDLAVLLAREGNLEQARELLLHSIRTSPQPTAWQNLSTVHQRLGEIRLAELAQRESTQLSQAASSGQAGAGVMPRWPVEWVAPQAFAATSVPPADLQPGQRQGMQPAGPVPAPVAPNRGVSWAERLPWNSTRR